MEEKLHQCWFSTFIYCSVVCMLVVCCLQLSWPFSTIPHIREWLKMWEPAAQTDISYLEKPNLAPLHPPSHHRCQWYLGGMKSRNSPQHSHGIRFLRLRGSERLTSRFALLSQWAFWVSRRNVNQQRGNPGQAVTSSHCPWCHHGYPADQLIQDPRRQRTRGEEQD